MARLQSPLDEHLRHLRVTPDSSVLDLLLAALTELERMERRLGALEEAFPRLLAAVTGVEVEQL